ncbi:MAG: BrnT family toxin [Caulobacter sp.]|nr:BrnT family toxin [Caulobacter sp.]
MGDPDDSLHFTWDAGKAAANLSRRRPSFEAAAFVFADPARLEEDDRFSRGEYRTIAIGRVAGQLVTVVFTEPENNLIRIISARWATPAEQKAYENSLLHT